MKFALCNEMFESWNTDQGFDFERCFRFIHECGYEGTEIAPFTIAPDAGAISQQQRRQIRETARGCGIEITGLHWLLAKTQGYYLTSPEKEVRNKTAAYFQTLVQLCADLGGKFMVLGSPLQRSLLPGVSQDQAMDYACDVLQQVVPILEKNDVQIAVEPLGAVETDFLTTAQSVVDLMKKIGAPKQVALHLDCKAMSYESEPIPVLIHRFRNELAYFHLNDPNRQGPGFGEMKFEPIMQALQEIDYRGWASVEPFDYSVGIERLARESLSYVRGCMNTSGA